MNDSVAIVTGASQGMGRCTANRLARDFSSVELVARTGNELEDVAGEVRQKGAEPLAIALDLSQVESLETVVKTTHERCGRIDARLNIAGALCDRRGMREEIPSSSSPVVTALLVGLLAMPWLVPLFYFIDAGYSSTVPEVILR